MLAVYEHSGESFGFLTQTNKAGTGIVWPHASGRTNRKHLGLRIEANGEIRNLSKTFRTR